MMSRAEGQTAKSNAQEDEEPKLAGQQVNAVHIDVELELMCTVEIGQICEDPGVRSRPGHIGL